METRFLRFSEYEKVVLLSGLSVCFQNGYPSKTAERPNSIFGLSATVDISDIFFIPFHTKIQLNFFLNNVFLVGI